MKKMKTYENPLGGPLLAMSLRVAALVGAVLSWGPVLRAPGDGDPRPPKPGVQGAWRQGALDHAWPGIGGISWQIFRNRALMLQNVAQPGMSETRAGDVVALGAPEIP